MANLILFDGDEPYMVMTPMRKELMHAAMDGDTELSGVMFILNQYVHCETFLKWLIFHKYTGNNLRDLIVNRFDGRVEKLVRYIIEQSKQRPTNART